MKSGDHSAGSGKKYQESSGGQDNKKGPYKKSPVDKSNTAKGAKK